MEKWVSTLEIINQICYGAGLVSIIGTVVLWFLAGVLDNDEMKKCLEINVVICMVIWLTVIITGIMIIGNLNKQ